MTACSEFYSDAYRRDDEAIANWIRSNTDYAGLTVTRAVRTLKALCAQADFQPGSVAPAPSPVVEPGSAQGQQSTIEKPAVVIPSTKGDPSVNIDIELHLPATNDPRNL